MHLKGRGFEMEEMTREEFGDERFEDGRELGEERGYERGYDDGFIDGQNEGYEAAQDEIKGDGRLEPFRRGGINILDPFEVRYDAATREVVAIQGEIEVRVRG